MVGVYGKAGSWIHQIGITCRRVNADGSFGSMFTRGPVGRDTWGSAMSASHPPGRVVYSIDAWSGTYVNSLMLRCYEWLPAVKKVKPLSSPISVAFNPLSPSDRGRDNPEARCPLDKVGKALRGKHGLYIDSMRFVCDTYDQ